MKVSKYDDRFPIPSKSGEFELRDSEVIVHGMYNRMLHKGYSVVAAANIACANPAFFVRPGFREFLLGGCGF